ncbi:MAG: TIGR00375 family protein [Candidatus Aenigmarchaeota archaeon]|nr:TIGR00375 family protein [Candidatus Aenigmarchaeota archaeon]
MSDFIEVNCDLHVHGLYSGAVSQKMIPKVIGEQALLKGLQLVGTADILNERWIKLIKQQLKPVTEDIFEHPNGTKFILQTEVEDNNRVHHIILFPSLSKVYELREKIKKHCKNLDTDGRPKLWLSAEQIAEMCIESDCLIGFAHAFTPYFSLYSKFDSYKDCYGKYWNKIHFLELGLSADTNMADRISELHKLTFLSNSDAHSPWPNKMGREFNKLKIKEISFNEISKALKREANRKCILNVGLNPLEGKYNRTRCRGCLMFFSPREAEKLNWRCPKCKNYIKKGVDYRIKELSDTKEGIHPKHRPKYIHIIPLSEIIAIALNIKQVWSNRVQDLWKEFVNKFENETNVLLNISINELEKVHKKTAELIKLFREDKFKYIPGGAGVYGIPVPPGKKINMEIYKYRQKGLSAFIK